MCAAEKSSTVVARDSGIGSVLNRIICTPWTLNTCLTRRAVVGLKSGGAVGRRLASGYTYLL